MNRSMKFKVGDKVMFDDGFLYQKCFGTITEVLYPSRSYYYRVDLDHGGFIHLLQGEMTLLSPVLVALCQEEE